MIRATKVFLPVLLFALFLLPTIVKAQSLTVGYDQFICLFEKVTANGKCSSPQPSPTDIKNGAASGVLYGKTDLFTPQGATGFTGITALTMQVGLWAEEKNEDKETRYYYSRIADARASSFFVRLTYTPTTSTTPKYLFIDIPYVKTDYSRPAADILKVTPKMSSIIIPRAGGGGNDQLGIAFYKDGPSGKEFVKQQVALVQSPIYTGADIIPYGTNMVADFWYCGGKKQGSATVDGRYAPREVGRIEYFTTDGKYTDINGSQTISETYATEKCGGDAAYKIGTSFPFTLPVDATDAQVESVQQLDSGITSSTYLGSVLPLCSIDPLTDGSVMGCVAQILYHGVFRPVAFFAQLMGQLFDFFLGYSLSDESYRHDFVQTGWQLVRDISNIFFIIIMIYSGLMAVFNTSSVSYKKVIPTLIINALIINFSLFATRIVIDMSNITARIFYNQMVVKIDGEEQKVESSSTGYKPISEAIVSSFNPQKIFEGSVLQSEDSGVKNESLDSGGSADFNSQSSDGTTGAKFQRFSREYAGYFALVTLVAIAITFSVAMMFWKTAFMFVGRVVGLYVAMIFSPFAFLSRGGVPLVSKLPALNYGAWWKDLWQYALLAPIFVFFLYIINAFLNVEFFTKVGLEQNGQGFFGSVMYVVIPMLIIYGLVTRGVKIAEGFAGDFGKMAQKLFTTTAGAGLGIVSGGLAMAGSRVIGGAASRLNSSRVGTWIRNQAPTSGLARKIQAGLDATSGMSFDVRKTIAGRTVLKEMGTNADAKGLNLLSGIGLGLGTDQRKGGFDADVKRRQDDQEKKQKLLEEKMSDDQIKGYNQKQQDKRADRIESLIEKAMIATHGKTNVADWKKNNKVKYDTEKAATTKSPAVQAEIAKIPPAKEMRSAAEMNKDRRKQFADNLKKPGLDGILGKVPVLGAVLGTTIGAALGANTRKTADKKAAKKIEESSKVEKELAEIEATLKKGFQDLIALDLFQTSPSFSANLSDSERQDIVKFGTIQTGPNKGKGMYDILTDAEKARIDADVKDKKEAMNRGTDDEKKKAKEEYEEYEDLIKARESNKFDLKDLRGKLKSAKDTWIQNPTDQAAKDAFREKLKEVKIAEKHQDKWRDLNNYIKTRRDKLKGEDKK